MTAKPRSIAIILAGCGNKDGAEIHESTLTLLAIHKAGAEYQCYAPDINQHHVLNFITGEEMKEERNVLIESARIARGDIKDLAEFTADEHDILIIPGGFGVAKNLCNFAFDNTVSQVNKDLKKAVHTIYEQKKPIGALCIAPVLLAKLIPGAHITIGQDPGTAEAVEKMGATHSATDHGEITIDRQNKLVTTPCYMLDARVDQIAEGAENLVNACLEMIEGD